MKEATSDLNATVVVVLAIAVLIAFFYYTLWPLLKNNFEKNSQCSKAICESIDSDNDGFVNCCLKNDANCSIKSGNNTFKCTFKG